MFIRGKPIRFGYKIWAICGNDGYPYKLKLYRGKEQNQPKLPLGTRVVNDMMSVIQSCSAVTRHEVYFDNFFTSHALLKSLAERNIKATGTIRENRTAGAAKLMKSNSALKKEGRGEFDFRCDGEVYVCKLNDNSIVSIASNHETHVPFHEATRRVKRSSNVKVKQPYLVHKYNEGMGGVDLIGHIPTRYKGQKMVLASVFQCPQLVCSCCLAHALSTCGRPSFPPGVQERSYTLFAEVCNTTSTCWPK